MDAFDGSANGRMTSPQHDGGILDQTGQAVAGSDFLSAAANVTAAAAAIPLAIQGVLVPDASGRIVLPAGVSIDDISVAGADLIITLPNGELLIIPNGAINVPSIVVAGDTVPASTVAQLLESQLDLNPEAGVRSSGGNFADAEGAIGDPYALGDLLPYTELAFPEPRQEEIIPAVQDEEPTTVIVTPNQPAGSTNATADVNEAGLPTRGQEPAGSNSAADSESTSGSILFDAPDGLGSVTINGVAITTVGQVVTTPLGQLTVTSIGAGSIGYTYTLADNTDANANLTDIFTVAVTDRDGDVATADLTISIIDDVPVARADTDSVAAGSFAPETGNVMTGTGTTSGNAGADTQGADGATITGARGAAGEGGFAAPGTVIQGQYGTLTIDAQGDYTYTRAPGTPGGVNDVFDYQLTDGDGDTSTATLTISIADSPGVITFVPGTGDAGTLVYESQLADRGGEPAGSQFDGSGAVTSGTITFTAADGVGSVTIDGVTVTPGALPQQIAGDATGTLTVTAYSYDPQTGQGSITYSYTLIDNTLDTDGSTVSFDLVVTDLDGDAASSALDIAIVDDAPAARPDVDSVTEDGPLTADGNVLTGAGGGDANGTDGMADVQGADGATVTAIAGGTVGTPLAGAYGSLTLNADGSYSYALNNASQPVQGLSDGQTLTETFTYTITDGDGDAATTTLTITINGANDGVTISDLGVVGGELIVNEDDLSDGSSPNIPALTQSGTFAVTTPDGLDDVKIGTAQVVTNGVFTPGLTTTSALGTVTITGFTPTTGADGSVIGGTFTYSYTLTDNTLTHTAQGEDNVTDSFAVTVTDSDGSTGSASLDVTIIDDVPAAADDSAAPAEDTPVVIDVLANDVRGADGVDRATGVALATPPAKGTVAYNGDGTFTYTPTAGQEGSDSFTYTITDGDGDTATATVTVSLSADSTPTLSLGADNSVNEAGLPAGSNAASNSETTTGSFALTTGNDSIGSLVINGVDVTAGGTVTSPIGQLTVTLNAGVYSYSYTLTTNTSGDNTSDSFAAVLTDSDGDVANDTLVIDIVDDIPAANPDVDNVTEDGALIADGNVLTGSGGGDTNNSDGVADVQGADGATVTSVVGGTIGTAFATAYGTLTLNANGSYSYVLDNNAQPVQGLSAGQTLTETFTYTITDGDGDPATTTLTITINGADDGVTISDLDAKGAELFFDEDDLPVRPNEAAGSDTTPEPVTGTDSFSVSTPDGMGAVVLDSFNGTPLGTPLTLVTANGSFTPQSIATAYGTLSVTAFTPVTGADGSVIGGSFTYSYTLTDNRTDHGLAGQDSLTDSVGVTVTDSDGSSASATIDVRITDDVPDAIDDGITQSVENQAVTINVLANDIQGADSVQPSAVELVAGSLTGTGTLVNNGDGSFTYQQAPGEVGEVSFDYQIKDGDGDTSTATATILLVADSAPQIRSVTNLTVDEDGLPGANADNGLLGEVTSTGSASASGTIIVDFGSDVPATLNGSLVLNDSAALDGQLTVDGAAVTFAKVGADLVGSVAGQEVIRITLTGATAGPGATEVSYSYSATLSQAVDQQTAGTEDSDILSGIGFTVTDSDGTTAPGSFSVTAIDDLPTLTVSDTPISAVEGGPAVTGSWTLDAGADGVTSVAVNFGTGNATLSLTPGSSVSITQSTGTLTVNADGSFSFLATGNQDNILNPSAIFTLSAVDGDGDPTSDSLTINIADGADPVGGGKLTLTVDEAALNGDGSNPASGHEVASGTLNFTAGSDTLSGFAFTGVGGLAANLDGAGTDIFWTLSVDGQTITGSLTDGGAAAITIALTAPASITPGTTASATVTVTLADNLPHELALAAQTKALGNVTVQASDTDGDIATGVVTVQVTDDVPAANPDVDNVTEDGALIADGNVLTGSGGGDTNNSDGVADVQGADGATVTSVVGGTIGTAFATAYGTLTLNANGSYSYVLDNNAQPVQGLSAGQTLTEIFTYTITDGDGDPATTTLTITINGADDGVTINGLDVVGGEEIVNEDDLSDGSSPNIPALTQTGSFTVTTPDGLDDVTIGTAQVVTNGVFTPGLTTTSALGVVTITGFTPTTGADGSITGGTFTYSYTLTDNTLTHTAQGEDNVTDSFAVTVADSDGSPGTASLDITIIDDVPTANPDAASVAEGGTIGGNVLTDGTADVFGADGAAAGGGVIGVRIAGGDTTTAVTGGLGGGGIPGQYGTLTLNADGSYSYVGTANAIPVGGGTEIFVYTIRDGDGDTSTTTLTITLSDSGLAATTQNAIVDEAALLIGSNPTSNAETTTGTLADNVSGGNGTLTFSLVSDPVGSHGTLTLNANGSYSYTLTSPVTGPNADNGANIFDNVETFTYRVTDANGNSTTNTVTIDVIDDKPVARPDVDDVTEDGALIADGNVLTGSGGGDTNNSDGVADTQGADGATVTSVVGGTIGTAFATAYGTLTLNADGSYSYVLNNASQPVQGLSAGQVLTEIFNYTITDGDGDTATTTLTITINGADDGVTINGLDVVGGEEIVNEDDLSDGSSPNIAALTQTGSFTVTTPDGLDDVTIGTAQVVTNGVFTPGLTTTSALGVVTITGFTPTTGADGSVTGGTFTYSYTLTDNTLTHTAQGEDNVTDSFAVTVTDSDGSPGTASLDITVIDDVPTASPEALQTLAEGTTVTGTLDFVQGADGARVTQINGTALVFDIDGYSQAIDIGDGMIKVKANGSYSFTADASVIGTGSASATYTVTDGDNDTSTAPISFTITDANVPTAGTTLASVDDDGLVGGNPASTMGDLAVPDGDGDNDESTFGGVLNLNFGNDGAGSVDFAEMHGLNGTIGTETVTYAWDADTNTLTATGPRGPLFTVQVTDPTTGAYQVTLLDNVLHTPGDNENDAFASLTYTVIDGDGSPANGSLDITFDDDAPTLGSILDAATSNNPATTPITGAIPIVAGADAPLVTTISANVSGMTSGGHALVTNQAGNVLTAYADTDNDGVYDAGTDTAVFTLTVDPTTNQYSFDLIAALDGDTVNTPISGSSAFGAGPTQSQILTGNGGDVAVVAGWNAGVGFDAAAWYAGGTANPAGLALSSVNGSTNGWGIDNQNFNQGEFLRFDFGSPTDDFDGVGGYSPPPATLPEVSYANFNLSTFGAGDTLQFIVHYTDGSFGAQTSPGGGTLLLQAPAGKFIDWVDIYGQTVGGGGGKMNLTSVGVTTTSVNETIDFTLTLTDLDGDPVTGDFSVTIADSTPTAVNDDIALTEGGPISVNFDVDTNDTNGGDGFGSRTFTSLTGAYGTITLHGGGTQTYTLSTAGQAAINALPPGQTLTDIFNYTLTDTDGDSDSARVTVTLTGTDDPVTITNLTPKADGGDVTVYEDDLPAGSDAAPKDSLTANGTFNISAPDGTANLSIGGIQVIANGVFTAATITSPLSNTLKIISYNAATGEVSYSYTLNGAETHGNAAANNSLFEDFTVSLTDTDGDPASSILSVNIVDDVPTARLDTDSVGTGTSTTGNVITGTGTTSGAAGADTLGADGATVVQIQGSGGATAVTAGGVVVTGQFGTLTIDSTGQYTYNRTSDADGNDVFNYMLRDADGDTSPTTLTIALDDKGRLVVGSNDSDDGSAPDGPHVVDLIPNTTGPVNGQDGDDILAGDPGALGTVTPGDTANVVFVLDTSGSMSSDIQFNGSPTSRLQALQFATSQAIDGLATSGAANVRIHLVQFNEQGGPGITFDLISNGVVNTAQVTAAKAVVDGFDDTFDGPGTNYNSALDQVQNWVSGSQVTFTDIGAESFDSNGGTANGRAVLLNSYDTKIAVVSAWNSAGSQMDVTGSSGAMGVNNTSGTGDDIDSGEILRFDFGAENGFGVAGFDPSPADGSTGYGTQFATFNGPPIEFATFACANIGGSESLAYTAFYTDGSTTVGTRNSSGSMTLGTNGKTIAYVQFTGNSTNNSGVTVELTDVQLDHDGPLTNAGVKNKVVFISDGEVNQGGTDFTARVTAIESAFGPIEAVGIAVSADALSQLTAVEGSGGSATNISNGNQLAAVIGELSGGAVIADVAGSDIINGGGGDDLIFGDVPFTDTLAVAAGLSTAPSSGWTVFQQLETGQGTGVYQSWTRADTINYLRVNQAQIAQESGRTGGHDTINGGTGNDIIYGQEGNDVIRGGDGNDVINGGSGNDILSGDAGNDSLTGGAGVDQFRFKGAGGGADTVIDFVRGTDKIGFLDNGNGVNGSVNFALTVGTAAGAALAAGDFQVRTSIANINAVDDNRVIILTNGQAATSIAADAASAINSYVVVYNNDAGRAEIWFDTDWSSSTGRTLIGVLDGVTVGGVAALTAADFVVFSSASDPLILDLDGNGFTFSAVGDGAAFDINADGVADQMAWNSSNDGILAVDLNGNGTIDSGTEIFTPGFAGGAFASGVQALASLDSNGDGVIDANDAAFADLLVWQDANADGVSDPGELSTLADQGITAIATGATAADAVIDGQVVTAHGSFTRADGTSGQYIEVQLDTELGVRGNARPADDAQRASSNQALVNSLVAASLVGMAQGVHAQPDVAPVKVAAEPVLETLAVADSAPGALSTPHVESPLNLSETDSAAKTDAGAADRSAHQLFEEASDAKASIDDTADLGSRGGTSLDHADTGQSDALFDAVPVPAAAPSTMMDGLLALGAQAAIPQAADGDATSKGPGAEKILADTLDHGGGSVDHLLDAIAGGQSAPVATKGASIDLGHFLDQQVGGDMGMMPHHQSVIDTLHQMAPA